MIYLLKFGASFVLPPGIFIVVMLLIAAILRYKGERLLARILGTAALALYLLSMPVVAGQLMRSLEGSYYPPEEPRGDVVIMLGGGALPDTPDIDGSGSLCAEPASRLLTAVRLAQKLQVPLICSGGQVYADTGAEAVLARRTALSLGMAPDKVIVEGRSLTTDQNAQYTAEILAARGYHRPLLVTSAFHMRRAVEHFKQHGVEVVPYPCAYQTNISAGTPHYNYLAPKADALEMSALVLQERLRYFVLRHFGK